MGSFAYTCALSELPIEAGDRCRIIPLVKSRLGLNGGACSEMELVFPAIKGTYNDYGYADNLEPTSFQEWCAQMLGYSDTADFAGKLKEGVVRKTQGSTEVAVCFSLVREDAWQAMLSMPGELYDAEYSRKEAGSQMKRACEEGGTFFAQARQALEEDKAGTNLVGLMASEEKNAKKAVQVLWRYVLGDRLEKYPTFYSVFGLYLEGYNSLYRGANISEWLVEWSLAGAAPEELLTALTEMGEQILVSANMNAVRKVWLYRNSSGPQGGEHELHVLWATKLLELAKGATDKS